ncbi:unnamed protein product [Microthlaspi erraticum]|uniref:Transmembrane protein n=1 Tax=Microthlaspi erraticum TaxID=1685480 RepID=A0A6D2L4E9_9BRAS|nr:unnamed protein product [Microthlaspi erraticum]
MVSREQDFEIDLEAGRTDVTRESTSERLNLGVPEKIGDDLVSPLMGNEKPAETSSQSSDLSGGKCDVGRKFKKSRKASKPPRPPKGASLLSAIDHKVMREIADLAMRKRARIERMKHCLRRIKAAKSSSSTSSSCFSVLSMIVTVLFLVFLFSQGLFAGNTSLSSDKSPAPVVSPNNRFVSVQFNNEFAPVEQTDPSPTTSFRYTRKRISGAEEEEDSRDVTR